MRCARCGSEHTAIIGNYLTAMFAIAICYDCGYHVSADGETVSECEKRAREGKRRTKPELYTMRTNLRQAAAQVHHSPPDPAGMLPLAGLPGRVGAFRS